MADGNFFQKRKLLQGHRSHSCDPKYSQMTSLSSFLIEKKAKYFQNIGRWENFPKKETLPGHRSHSHDPKYSQMTSIASFLIEKKAKYWKKCSA